MSSAHAQAKFEADSKAQMQYEIDVLRKSNARLLRAVEVGTVGLCLTLLLAELPNSNRLLTHTQRSA